MNIDVIDLKGKFDLFDGHWQPKIIAGMNDYHLKIAKIEGDFVWHSHPETDELFYIVQGELRIDLRDGVLELSEGQLCVIPKGVEHKPYAEAECWILMIELAGTLNTGDADSDRAVEEPEWI